MPHAALLVFLTSCLCLRRMNSPQISSGTGCWLGCISPPSRAPPCSCPQRPCTLPAGWPGGTWEENKRHYTRAGVRRWWWWDEAVLDDEQLVYCFGQHNRAEWVLASTFKYHIHTYACSSGRLIHFYSRQYFAWSGHTHTHTQANHIPIMPLHWWHRAVLQNEPHSLSLPSPLSLTAPLSAAALYVHCNSSCRPAVHEYASCYSYAWMAWLKSWLHPIKAMRLVSAE